MFRFRNENFLRGMGFPILWGIVALLQEVPTNRELGDGPREKGDEIGALSPNSRFLIPMKGGRI